nr:reverse transcriptase domain-containing protein [Tanacetum cinerariifolium]
MGVLHLKSVHVAHRGPLPSMVFRDPDSRKFQLLPEVQGKGKEKVINEKVFLDLLTLQTLKNISPSKDAKTPVESPIPTSLSSSVESTSPIRMPSKRTSTSEAPAMTQDDIKKLVADNVSAALEAQAANMENTNNTTIPRETLVVRKCTYKEFMSRQPFYFNGTKGVVGLIHWFERTESEDNSGKDEDVLVESIKGLDSAQEEFARGCDDSHWCAYTFDSFGLIRRIKIGSSDFTLSHLFYADDVIITTDWNSGDLDMTGRTGRV